MTAPTLFDRVSIHLRCHLSAGGQVSREGLVRCPRGGWRSLASCGTCPQCEHLSTPTQAEDWLLLCRLTADLFPSPGERAGAWRHAAVATVCEAMTTVLCVSSDVSARVAARALAEERLDLGVVADAERHHVGVVTRSDLLGALVSQQKAEARVAEVMSPFVMTFLDATSIADAMRLVTSDYLHHVPVVSGDEVVGLVTPASLLAWLQRELIAAERPFA